MEHGVNARDAAPAKDPVGTWEIWERVQQDGVVQGPFHSAQGKEKP